jgi:hypothetical protein
LLRVIIFKRNSIFLENHFLPGMKLKTFALLMKEDGISWKNVPTATARHVLLAAASLILTK